MRGVNKFARACVRLRVKILRHAPQILYAVRFLFICTHILIHKCGKTAYFFPLRKRIKAIFSPQVWKKYKKVEK